MDEKEKLPLIFEYLEKSKVDFDREAVKNSIYYVKSRQFQTDFLVRQKPFKPLVRMI